MRSNKKGGVDITEQEKRKSHINSVAKYNKSHYAEFKVLLAPAVINRIAAYCNHYEISKAEFIRRAIQELD